MEYEILRYDKPVGKPGTDVMVRFVDSDKNIDTIITFWWEHGEKPSIDEMQDRLNSIATKILEDTQTQEQQTLIEASIVDTHLIDLKYKIKKIAMLFIKNNSECSMSDVKIEIENKLGQEASLLTEGFFALYEQEAYKRGLIKNPTFEDLKTLIQGMSLEQLANMK